MAQTNGFLRPVTSKDIADMIPKGVLSVPVAKSMNESQDLSFAQAIMLEVSRGTPSARSAKQFLDSFVKINFVGGYQDTSIHSRGGLKELSQSTSQIDGPSSVVHNLNTKGAASLTLKELESLLPMVPGNDPKENLARKKSKTPKYIESFWKRPNNPVNHLVAWNLLEAIKAGNALPNARENLDRFVQALQGGIDDNEELPDDLDMQIDNLIEETTMHGGLPSQPQLQAQTMPLPCMNGHDAAAPNPLPPHPLPPKPSYDYGEVARIAAAGTNRGIASVADPNFIRLFEIPDTEQDLQRRYFHITDGGSLVRCLCCGKEGHMEESCPSRTCAHCGALDEHFSGACPRNQHCGRCRQRGHTTAECTVLSSSLMRGLNYMCDICDRPDHVEEECSELWRNSLGDDATIVQIPQQAMQVSCYNCGASGYFAHWGDDCPNFSPYDRSIKSLNPTWSKKYADKFIQSTSLDKPRSDAGHESVPSYQLAMLADM
jgi:hypothetical protein